MASIIEIPDEPKFTIKTVSDQTGIRAVTLRAWERRHEILSPHREENKYRLYSERDVAILRWIKERVDNGISISNATNEWKTMVRNGIWPDALPTSPQVLQEKTAATPPSRYASQLFESLVKHDEERASDLLRQAHAIFDIATICKDVITPCLVEIGEAWYYGKIRVATEHFASTFFRGKLLSLFQSYPVRRSAPYILIGCAPNEYHEIGSLMLAVLLRREGYRMEYLGPDVPVDDLVDYADQEKPAMIILSATSEEAAREMKEVQSLLQNVRPRPIFGFGGRIFWMEPGIQSQINGNYLGDTFVEAIQSVRKLLPPAR